MLQIVQGDNIHMNLTNIYFVDLFMYRVTWLTQKQDQQVYQMRQIQHQQCSFQLTILDAFEIC